MFIRLTRPNWRLVICLLLAAFMGGVMMGASIRSDWVQTDTISPSTLKTADAAIREPELLERLPMVTSTISGGIDIGQGQVHIAALHAPDDQHVRELHGDRRRSLPDQISPIPLDFWQLRQPSIPTMRVNKVQIQSGDTLMKILTENGIAPQEAHRVISSLVEIYDPRNLRPGQHLKLETHGDPEGSESKYLTGLSLNLDFENDLRMERDPDGSYSARIVELPLDHQIRTATAIIDDSLYAAARSQSVPDRIVLDMIKLFSWDVDFQRDIQRGDQFQLTYEMVQSQETAQAQPGELLYASLRTGNRDMEAYRYVHADGTVHYYDSEGRALRKWLMRTPIDGARLSSGFGMRKHPILGYSRMHKGVDFAAPRGTPIYAAGDGSIEYVGRNGGYGNYIRIRHNGDYKTAYAHLSDYAKGLSQGDRVKQGQVIGYVGSTGKSTGPHLHYEVIKGDKAINPLSVKITEVVRLDESERARFEKQITSISKLTSESQTASAAETLTR